jgi:hypothetical protein
MGFNPVLARFNACPQSLSGCPPPHLWLALAIRFPIELEAEEGEPAFAARKKAAEAVDTRLRYLVE